MAGPTDGIATGGEISAVRDAVYVTVSSVYVTVSSAYIPAA